MTTTATCTRDRRQKDAYDNNAEYGYAVGVIFGHTAESAHAVNIFIDTQGVVKILEPQGGTIINGSAWRDSNGELCDPTFILM